MFYIIKLVSEDGTCVDTLSMSTIWTLVKINTVDGGYEIFWQKGGVSRTSIMSVASDWNGEIGVSTSNYPAV